jgi:hypothetical protein
MKPLHARMKHVVRPLVTALALAACGVEERDHLRGELAQVRRERDELVAKAGTAETEAKAARVELLALKKGAEEAATLRAEKKALEEKAEKDKKEADRVLAHRAEMKEWIEEELLPIAEKNDPRLVNLRDAAKDMGAEVERLRGLKFKTPFMRRLLTRPQIGQWMKRDLEKDMTDEDVRKLVNVGAEFGLLAPKTDVRAMISEFMEAGAAAFYKPETRTFYHIEGNDGRGARPVIFHELVHAVEDQYFDLDKFYRDVEKNEDEGLARRALVEGSACHFASKYEKAHPEDVREMMKSQMDPKLMQKQMKMTMSVPPILIATVGLYPYQNAPSWMGKIGADDSAALEKLYADPPVSTEQVLHAAKFPLSGPRDYPHKIAPPDLAPVLGEAYESIDENCMGELQTGILLTQLQNGGKYVPTLGGLVGKDGVTFKGAAKIASEGWDGDRYAAWIEKAGDKVVIGWTSVWDTELDAKEFRDTYAELLGKRALGKDFKATPDRVRYTHADGRVSGIELSGTKVCAVLGAPADKAEAVLAACAAAKVEADPRDATDR